MKLSSDNENVLNAGQSADHPAEETLDVSALLTSIKPISFKLNGSSVTVNCSGSKRLSDALRHDLDCLDVKVGCNAGDCGACSVLVEGEVVCSCITAIGQVEGKSVQSISGLTRQLPIIKKLQHSFLKHGAAQCGICTPGMLVSAACLLQEQEHPTEPQVKDALGGVLCRCTGYRKIIDAVLDVHQADNTDCDNRLDQSTVVGVPIQRLDGEDKVLGTDTFGDDHGLQEAMGIFLIRSPIHHGTFEMGDIDAFVRNSEGLVRVLTAKDVPGVNRFGVIPPFIDQPVFAENQVRFKGEVVAAVVGDWKTMQGNTYPEFPVIWHEKTPLLDVRLAMNSDALPIHVDSQNNILCRGLVRCGDADAGLEQAVHRVSGKFTTGFIEHAYIEPEAGYARRIGDKLELFGCTQAPYMDRDSLAAILGLPSDDVRIMPSSVGGGFGSKLDLSFQPYIAIAAWLLNRPVRIAYTRTESMQSTTKRHPADMEVSIGVDEKGMLCGFTFDGVFNTGAYASWGPTVANRVPIHASGPYYIPNYTANTTGVYTHSSPAGAFRGFGVPQAAIAQESLFDELAKKLNMDRLEFRLLNALDNHQKTVSGQTFTSSVGIKPCLKALQSDWEMAKEDAVRFNLNAESSGSPVKRGIGIASGWYGCGNTSLPNPSTMKAGIRGDGTVCLHQGAVDIGQGSTTVITQIFSQTLGIPIHQIRLIDADTSYTPDAGKTSASRQTFVSGNAVQQVALALRSLLARHTNCADLITLDVRGDELTVNRGQSDQTSIQLATLPQNSEGYVFFAEEAYDPPTKALDENGQGVPYALYGYAAQMAIVDVDTRLGSVQLVKITAAHDVGRAINPQLVEGQIQGGVAQGIGLALMEEFIPGRTDNLHDYLIPTIGDVPSIDTLIVEVEDPHGPFGAKGLGEHVLIPTAPAILNAISDAIGCRLYSVPATPDKVLAAIQSNEKG